ncbi:MAG: DUF3383 family protein [Spirochaetales bacterium]|nr:DUF3383 family protein [Spirochaetales bacterium]
MGEMDRTVELSISKATSVVSQKGFGIIAVFDEFAAAKTTTAFNERVRAYSGIDEMVSDGWTDEDLAKNAAGVIFSQEPSPSEIVICRKDAAETWAEAAAAAKLENDSWYGMIITTRTEADQKAIADWAEANGKLLGLSSSDSKIKDAGDDTDVGSYIKSKNYERSFMIYHPDAGGDDECFADAAWLANRFPYTPGKTTWKFVTLKGVSVYTLTTSEINAILGKNVNFYTTVNGLSCTEEGTVGSGEYIDVTRGIDWLHARMQEGVFQLKKSATDRGEKVAMTDPGITQVDSVMKEVLETGVENQLLAADPEPTTSVPLAEDVSVANKGARTLPDATFEAYLAGAIHKTKIMGVVTL